MSKTPAKAVVNNRMYDTLGARWYVGQDHPIALLRAEARLKNPWVLGTLAREFEGRACRVLDVGCGGGLLSNALARGGHEVTGVDLSRESLEVARGFDETRGVFYQVADATRLPYAAGRFDAVCAMDLLEHVSDPGAVIRESSRVLSEGGLFFFHTFNRNILSWLIAVKAMEWFVRGTPENLHLLSAFIKPRELRRICLQNRLRCRQILGIRPRLSRAIPRLLLSGEVPEDFRFVFTRSTWVGYCGFARKQG